MLRLEFLGESYAIAFMHVGLHRPLCSIVVVLPWLICGQEAHMRRRRASEEPLKRPARRKRFFYDPAIIWFPAEGLFGLAFARSLCHLRHDNVVLRFQQMAAARIVELVCIYHHGSQLGYVCA